MEHILSRLLFPLLLTFAGPANQTAFNGDAIIISSVQTFEVSAWHQFNFCTGEVMEYSAQYHLIFTGVINNNKLIMQEKLAVSNIRGVGLSSGLNYRGAHTEQAVTIETDLSGAFTYFERGTIRMISCGAAPDGKINFILKTTVQTDGTVTTQIEDIKITCL